jgi:VWFA-related protein
MRGILAWLQGVLVPAVLMTALPVAAQEPVSDGTGVFRDTVDVEVVNIEVFVTDKQGQPVVGLQKQDFQLLVDGEPTPITNFYAEVGGQAVIQSPAGDTLTSEETAAHDGEIGRFEPEEQRLHLVIFIDCGQSMPQNRRPVFDKLDAFLETMLSPGDLVSVISYDQGLKIHSGFQPDYEVLREILDQVQKTASEAITVHLERQELIAEILGTDSSFFGRNSEEGDASSMIIAESGRNLMVRIRAHAQSSYHRNLDSINALQSVVRTLSGVHGRKAVIHVSDGIATQPGMDLYEIWKDIWGSDSSSFFREIGEYDIMPAVEEMARVANAGRVTIYAIDAEKNHKAMARSAAAASGAGAGQDRIKGSTLTIMDAIYREPIELAANTTGGRRVQASWRLDQDLQMIASDLATCYSLGFEHKAPGTGKTHRIKVKLVNPEDRQVRHRLSYSSDPRSDDERFAAEVMASAMLDATSNRLQAELEPDPPRPLDDTNQTLPIKVILPIRSLMLLPQDQEAILQANLSFFVTVKDQAGNARPIQKLRTRLRIPEAEHEHALGTYAVYEVPAIIRSGDQKAVIGIRDDTTLTTSTLDLALSPWTGYPGEPR